jgi:CheY-like chemotaxis protein
MNSNHTPSAMSPRLPPIRRTDQNGQFHPDSTSQYIGLQIRTGRRLMGWSRAIMAEHLGIDADLCATYEHGARDVPAPMLARIADVLGKKPEWFYHRPSQVGRSRQAPAAPAPAMPMAAPAPAAGDQKKRVLLVDDAADVLVTLGAFLEGAGLTVIKARSGDEALAIVASDQMLDAIVTDNAMPGLSGTDLLLQSAQMRPGLPGLIVTGYADTASLGALPPSVGILCKPFRREELVSRVREMTQPAPAPTAIVEEHHNNLQHTGN